jgi:hypothetical protein
MHVEIVNVTPALAKEFLRNNKINRPVKAWAINKYAKDLSSGQWASNHQGIAFDKDGSLADGQHRLMAIVKTQIPIDMVVAWGVDRQGIDRLAPRSQMDEIKYAGMSDWVEKSHLVIAGAMFEISYNGAMQNKASRTTSENIDFCEKHRAVIEFTASKFRKKEKYLSAAIIQGTVAIAATYEDVDRMGEFVNVFKSGLPNSQKDFMAIKARNFIMNGGAKGGATDRKNASKTLMRAIYLFCRGKNLNRLVPPKEFTYTLEGIK